MVDPNDKPLAYVGGNKREWYLKKGLATLIEKTSDYSKIKLNFYPNIKEEQTLLKSIFPKENKCVCCGSFENLSRHHVVPSVFLRHLPEKHKEHKSDFVVCLCVTCHRCYEREVISFKKEVAKKYNVAWFSKDKEYQDYLDTMKIWKGLHIVLHSKKSEEEKDIFREELKKMGYFDFSKDGLFMEIEKMKPKVNDFSFTNWPKIMMNKIILDGEEAIGCFVNTMNPNIGLPFEEIANGIRDRA
jgi:hypothetical protein